MRSMWLSADMTRSAINASSIGSEWSECSARVASIIRERKRGSARPPRALAHRDFRRFYAAQLLALVGGWMQTVAQAWLVLQLTDSPFKLGLISTLQFSPILMFSLVAGAVADRLPKRGLLVTTQTSSPRFGSRSEIGRAHV